MKIPALVNTASGSAVAASHALASHEAFDLREVGPDDLEQALEDAVAAGAPRILVAGGDGTVATAAERLLSRSTELAILPGGTLNHFARDMGISTEVGEALATAAGPVCRTVDVGLVNSKLFLNTSSVGAYVRFVRVREQLERRFGYHLASTIAALRILFQLRLITVEVEVDGARRVYRTPLVFIGVGERDLQLPTLGQRAAGGRRGLHVIVVRGRSRARIFAIALGAAARGVKKSSRRPELDSFVVDRCTITTRNIETVAVDGELVKLHSPLEYTLRRDALRVVCP